LKQAQDENENITPKKGRTVMFLENYRIDTMVGGESQTVIPYPKISDEDWRKWKAFLPVKSQPFCKRVLLRNTEIFLKNAYSIPPDVYREMTRAASYFDEIEVWGKREIRKDPIAVGITENGARYLICRWGSDKLIPFERIRSRSWLYHIQNFGVILLNSENFWFSTAVTVLLMLGYVALWWQS
jgi:hypothetical protein